jgi:hypothetical protein
MRKPATVASQVEPVQIVDHGRPVKRYPRPYLVTLEYIDPTVIDQHTVRLQGESKSKTVFVTTKGFAHFTEPRLAHQQGLTAVKDEIDGLELVIARCAGREGAKVVHYFSRNQRRVLFPCFVAAEKEVAVVAFQVATLANLKNDVQMFYFHWFSIQQP